MRTRPKNSQIATILTLVMAVIFLFIVITINIGNIAQEKTMVSNVSDNAALLLASMLGSLSSGLRMKIGLWGNKDKDCDLDLLMVKIIAAAIALVLSIILTIGTLGAGAPATVGAVLGLVGLIASMAGSAAVFIGGVLTAVQEPGSFKQAQLQFMNMTFEERLKEMGIQASLYSLVNDPNKVCDNGAPNDPSKHISGDPNAIHPVTKKKIYGDCIDYYDLDMDGRTRGDCVSPFALWYTERLKSLPRKGDSVQYVFDALFFNPRLQTEEEKKKEKDPSITGKLPRIYVRRGYDAERGEETWKAASYGFWIDTNNNLLADPDESTDPQRKGHLTLDKDVYTDDHQNPAGVVYKNDIYFVDWLEQRFIPLVRRLHEYGYGIDADLKKTLGDILFLISGEEALEGGKTVKRAKGEIVEFEEGIAELYGSDFDSRLQSFEEWMQVFYNRTSDKDHQDWYYRMGEWLNVIQRWINTLDNRVRAINTCVFNTCWAPGPYECGYGSGECCSSHCECWPCDDGADAGGSSGVAVASLNWYANTITNFDTDANRKLYAGSTGCGACCSCVCDAQCGCNPAGRFGGQLCPSGHCRPAMPCTTPADGGKGGADTPCCTIADNGLYYQLCDATTHSVGGNGPCDSPCTDTYYNCGFNPSNNVITREHTIEYLKQFVADVQAIRDAFKKASDDAQLKESDPRLYEAVYVWEDNAGRRGEITSQRVKHAVYVRLSDELKPNDKDPEKGFQIPYPHTYREWGWPSFGNRKCTEIARAKDEFGIVVGRYDQDVGKAETAPLRKLWVFKMRPKVSGTEPAFPLSYIAPKSEVTDTARKFVLENGIVSATKAYYGPGYTYTKEQLRTRDPNILKAREFNKDIKIEKINWRNYIKDGVFKVKK